MSSNQIATNGQPTKRIEYIDALRGFTMILVVMLHVASYCWHLDGVPSVHLFLYQIRMPMFFFISGFVLYKAGVVWDTKQVISFFRKKIPVQLLSPFVFFALFAFTRGFSVIQGSIDASRSGYWFTFVLFIYYVFYASVRFCFRNKYADIILLLIGIALFTVVHPTIYAAIPLSNDMKEFLCILNWNFFIFFVLGTLAKKYFSQFEKILDNTPLLAICILTYFLVNGYLTILPFNRSIPYFLSFPGLIVLFSFFRKKQAIFKKDNVLGLSLQYIGRRTLDVYLIHFFLLPRKLIYFSVFRDYPMPVLEGACSLLIALIIVAACLLIGNIIRLSPFLAHWVFGAKYPTTTTTK